MHQHFFKAIILTGIFFLIYFVLICTSCKKYPLALKAEEVFTVNQPDYSLSPYTGMTRQHWIEAAEYLLNGAFSYITTIDDPMKFPKQPGISYPRSESRYPTEKLEGLCRTLYIAMPLLKEKPDLILNNIKVADYYRHHLKSITDSLHSSFILSHKEKEGPSQNLVEFGALAISLSAIPEILWDPLTQQIKDYLAATMLSYAEGPTVPSNWRFFNIFVLSFLKTQGYEINEQLLENYIKQSLNDYRGDGWYIDNSYFDYYSMWAYQYYGILWCHLYGNTYPQYMQSFISNFKDMIANYPYMFDRNGQMIMWGRSIAYRFASISPLPLAGYLNEPTINYGWLRRISSATLLQFLQNKNLLADNVPTLGYYGAFEPAVQSYSCRGSVYWMGKAFSALLLPGDNIFWIAVENEGAWESELKQTPVNNRFYKETNILITNYPVDGISEIRSCPNVTYFPEWENWRISENYNKLSYNSRFPWMADGKNGEVAMNYMVKNEQGSWEPLTNYIFNRFENSTYYREAFSNKYPEYKFQLAEIPLSNGILRIDKVSSPDSIEIRLGNYALPQYKNRIEEKLIKKGKYKARTISNDDNTIATIPLQGWQDARFIHTEGLHPESRFSTVINVSDKFCSDKIYITLMLWKTNAKAFTTKELFPVKDIFISEDKKEIKINFNDNTIRTIFFNK